jgi:nitrate reductase gamma subunit
MMSRRDRFQRRQLPPAAWLGCVLFLLLLFGTAGVYAQEPGAGAGQGLPADGSVIKAPAENISIYEVLPRLYHRKGEDLVRGTGKECRECHIPEYYPQNDFFGWEYRKKWTLHWALFSVAVFFLLLGVYSAVSIWFKGRSPSMHQAVHWPSALNSFFRNGLLGERIWRQSKLRWAVFFLVSVAFLMLAGVFGLIVLNRFVFPQALPFARELGLVLDFLADFLGGCILVGTLLAMYRRIPGRKDSQKTEFEDMVILVLLMGVIVTGFFLEACRLAVVSPAPEVWASFLGALGGRILNLWDLPWTVVRFYVWIFHAVLVFCLLAYLPFSKLFHLFAAPVTIAATASEAHYKQHL